LAPRNKPKIFITQPILPEGLRVLQENAEVHQNGFDRPLTEDEMVEIGSTLNPDAYLGTFAEPHRVFSERVMEATKNLRVLAWNGLGFDHIDVDAATKRGIPVTYVDVHCATVSDQAFALLMCAARRIAPAFDAVRAGRWGKEGNFLNMNFMGNNIHHQTIGIVGLGRIGGGVAKRATGFDMRILYCDEVRRPEMEATLGVKHVSLDVLLRESDFVVCCVPLSATTENMFDRSAFGLMKKSAIFVNVTRGRCVDTDALYAALKERRIQQAALDVIEPEPLPSDHPILELDNLLIVPHIAGLTQETRTQSHIDVANDAIRALNGFRPRRLLNPDVLRKRPLAEAPDSMP